MNPDLDRTARGPRPIFIIGGLALVVLLAAVLTPEPTQSKGKGGMTTYSSALDGAQLFFDLARHLGWHVARRETPIVAAPPPSTIQILLEPSEPVTAAETHALLDGVRRGGALLIAAELGAPGLEDSLHLGAGGRIGLVDATSPPDSDCRRLFEEMPLTAQITPVGVVPQVVWTSPPPSPPIVLAKLRDSEDYAIDLTPTEILTLPFQRKFQDQVAARTRRRDTSGRPVHPAAVGFTFGAGRIVFIAGAELLSNGAIRACRSEADLLAVRALHYLSDGSVHRDVVVFDEYHHGYGVQPSGWRAVRMFVASTSIGQMLTQVAVAGLLLLFAAGPRPVPPRDPVRVARRSPLEQADALANAYQAVHGTRTVAARLLGGVRRRTGMAQGVRTLDDDAFLTQVATAHPAIQADTALVRRALREAIDDKELPALSTALQHIEVALSGTIFPPTRTT